MAPVCPDREIYRWPRRHQVRLAHDAPHRRPPERIKPLTEHSVDIEGRGRKAVSGNYCSHTVALVPRGTCASRVRCPPWASIIFFAMTSPKPVPWVFVVKNG